MIQTKRSDMSTPANLIERVAHLIADVSATAIEPRFASATGVEVREKSPGELVTDADEESERLITAGLQALMPGVPVVGEEGCAADPTLLDALRHQWAWLVDPIDGTGNFAGGSADWAVMVSLQHQSETVMSWIWQPAQQRMYVAERGGGATLNGVSLTVAGRAGDGMLRGAVLRRFLDAEIAERIDTNAVGLAELTNGRNCAGVEYPEIIDGGQDFALFWRTLPWDHAPPALLLKEAGGSARRPDGTVYEPGDARTGLLVAASEDIWARAVRLLDVPFAR